MVRNHAVLWPLVASAGFPERWVQMAEFPSRDRQPFCGGTAWPPAESVDGRQGHLQPAGRSLGDLWTSPHNHRPAWSAD